MVDENPHFTPEQRRLAEYMSYLSQECYCAGWMHYLEYDLWRALLGIEKHYGQCDPIEEQELNTLRQLSDACGGWVVWKESDDWQTWVPLAEWEAMFAAWKKEHPELAAWKKEHPA